MSGKRASDACIDFESDGLSNLPEEPLLKKKTTGSAVGASVVRRAMTEVKEESADDLEIADHGSQPGVCEREVDEESIKTADTDANHKLSTMFPANFKVPSCFMCGMKANAPSPLLSEIGSFIAWRSYKK